MIWTIFSPFYFDVDFPSISSMNDIHIYLYIKPIIVYYTYTIYNDLKLENQIKYLKLYPYLKKLSNLYDSFLCYVWN